MSLNAYMIDTNANSFPRPRGDEPHTDRCRRDDIGFSPPARG